MTYRVDLNDVEVETLFSFFDKDKKNVINYEGFLKGVRVLSVFYFGLCYKGSIECI